MKFVIRMESVVNCTLAQVGNFPMTIIIFLKIFGHYIYSFPIPDPY